MINRRALPGPGARIWGNGLRGNDNEGVRVTGIHRKAGLGGVKSNGWINGQEARTMGCRVV